MSGWTFNITSNITNSGFTFPLTGISNKFYFRDVSFNGQEFEVGFFIRISLLNRVLQGETTTFFGSPIPGDVKFNLKFVLQHITEEHYWFHVTEKLQEKIGEDPFAEPVKIRMNVENGLGMFAGFNQDEFVLEVD